MFRKEDSFANKEAGKKKKNIIRICFSKSYRSLHIGHAGAIAGDFS